MNKFNLDDRVIEIKNGKVGYITGIDIQYSSVNVTILYSVAFIISEFLLSEPIRNILEAELVIDTKFKPLLCKGEVVDAQCKILGV